MMAVALRLLQDGGKLPITCLLRLVGCGKTQFIQTTPPKSHRMALISQ